METIRFFVDILKIFSRLLISVYFLRISCPKSAFLSSYIEKVLSWFKKLPYSEVAFQMFTEDLKSDDNVSELDRTVAYFYVSFDAYRVRMGIIRCFTFLQLLIQIEPKIIRKVFGGFCSYPSGCRMWRF